MLTYRVLAAFTRLHALGAPVDLSVSTIDESGMGGGPANWLTDYPAVERMTVDRPFGFWRAKLKETEFVVETEPAILHRRDGSTVSLPAKYTDVGRSFGQLLGFVLSSS